MARACRIAAKSSCPGVSMKVIARGVPGSTINAEMPCARDVAGRTRTRHQTRAQEYARTVPEQAVACASAGNRRARSDVRPRRAGSPA
eukprot:3407957-Pleurochrysis_carterae.AAC.6